MSNDEFDFSKCVHGKDLNVYCPACLGNENYSPTGNEDLPDEKPNLTENWENIWNPKSTEAIDVPAPEFDGHKVWDCIPCEGNGYLNDNPEENCDCQCHIDANKEIEPEKPKTQREILDEMIERGEAKRVSVRFTPGSTIHKEPCPYCGQVAIETSRTRVENKDIIELECGHTLTKSVVNVYDFETYKKIKTGRNFTPYDFQAEGAVFLDKCNGRGLIADEMGLGKTIQALIWLKEHKEAWPFIIVTKASLKVNWYREIIEWLGIPLIQFLDSSNEVPIPNMGFVGYIVSVDTVGRAKWVEDITEHDFIKTVVLDECQTIKNMNAKRTKAVRNLCQGKDHIIGLSGTPVKNNAAEYFPVLNILRPEKFYGWSPFIQTWVEVYRNGYSTKAGGIRPDKLDEWNDLTRNFIIRRKRLEVMPQLPKIMRSFQYHDLGDHVRKAYTEAFDDFMNACSSNSIDSWTNTLAAMSRMRHLTGIAKIDPCVSHVEDFLLNNPEEKLAIFAHHTSDVIPTLGMKIDQLLVPNNFNPCLYITGQTPSELRQELVDQFKNNPLNRIMILSTLAAGEGLNLQFVSNCVMLERQWNPANEEQAEGRFSRIGARENTSISAVYMVAIDTIDEFFAKLVEQKRSFMASTLDGESYQWDETSLMKELAAELQAKGRKPWMMQKNAKVVKH